MPRLAPGQRDTSAEPNVPHHHQGDIWHRLSRQNSSQVIHGAAVRAGVAAAIWFRCVMATATELCPGLASILW
jgi:hypothetical protein